MSNSAQAPISYSNASKQLIRLTMPIAGSRLVAMLTNIIATLMLARLGHTVLAATALATSTLTLFVVVPWAVLFSVGIIVGRAVGAKKYKHVGAIYRQGLLLGTFISVPLAIIGYNVGPILLFFKQDPQLVALTIPFMHIVAFSITPSMWYICATQTVVGVGKARLPLYWSGINLSLNTSLYYIFILGHFGAPRLGLTGMAISMTITYWTIGLGSMLYFAKHRDLQIYAFFKPLADKSVNHLKTLFSIGWPICVQFGAELIAFTVTTIFMGWLGATALAAQQIVQQYYLLSLMFAFSLAQACGVLIGQALGGREYQNVIRFGYASLLISILFTVFVAVLFLAAPKLLLSLFINVHAASNQAVIKIAISLFIVTAFSQIFDALRNVATGCLRGFQDTRTPMWVGVIVVWLIALPLNYLGAFTLGLGAIGLRLGFLVAFIVGAYLLIRRFQQRASSCYS